MKTDDINQGEDWMFGETIRTLRDDTRVAVTHLAKPHFAGYLKTVDRQVSLEIVWSEYDLSDAARGELLEQAMARFIDYNFAAANLRP